MASFSLGCSAWCLASNAWGVRQAREAWVFEQLALPPLPTLEGEGRNQTGVNLSNYDDSLSLQGTAILDLREMEIGVRGSQRIFLSLTPNGVIRARSAERSCYHFRVCKLPVTTSRAIATMEG